MTKPKVTGKHLLEHGITWNRVPNADHPGNHGYEKLPAHVQIVRDGILDFDNFIIKQQYESADAHPKAYIRKCNLPSSPGETWKYRMFEEFIDTAQQLASQAAIFANDKVHESEWQQLFSTTVFKRRVDQHFTSAVNLNVNNTKPLAWNTNATTSWNDAHSIQSLDGNNKTPTAPKPDVYCGFSIYDLDPTQYLDSGFAKDDFIQNFSVDTLSKLKLKGLCAAPSSGFAKEVSKRRKSKGTRERITRHELLCFPWAVVELKRREEGDEDKLNLEINEAYIQAANGGSAALCMLETLARFAEVEKDNQHIPPVVTITCVGARAEVWLAFSRTIKGESRNHRMVCIWEGYISKEWDSIQFCRIIENTFAWAEKILRPKVSNYIDQWKFNCFSRVSELRTQLRHDPYLCQLAQNIEKSLNSLSFHNKIKFTDVAELITRVLDMVDSSSAQASEEEETSAKPDNSVGSVKLITSSETPLEERKLSDLTLGDLTEHLQRLGPTPIQQSPIAVAASPPSKRRDTDNKLSPTVQALMRMTKSVDRFNNHIYQLENSQSLLFGSQMLLWSAHRKLSSSVKTPQTAVKETQTSDAKAMGVSALSSRNSMESLEGFPDAPLVNQSSSIAAVSSASSTEAGSAEVEQTLYSATPKEDSEAGLIVPAVPTKPIQDFNKLGESVDAGVQSAESVTLNKENNIPETGITLQEFSFRSPNHLEISTHWQSDMRKIENPTAVNQNFAASGRRGVVGTSNPGEPIIEGRNTNLNDEIILGRTSEKSFYTKFMEAAPFIATKFSSASLRELQTLSSKREVTLSQALTGQGNQQTSDTRWKAQISNPMPNYLSHEEQRPAHAGPSETIQRHSEAPITMSIIPHSTRPIFDPSKYPSSNENSGEKRTAPDLTQVQGSEIGLIEDVASSSHNDKTPSRLPTSAKSTLAFTSKQSDQALSNILIPEQPGNLETKGTESVGDDNESDWVDTDDEDATKRSSDLLKEVSEVNQNWQDLNKE